MPKEGSHFECISKHMHMSAFLLVLLQYWLIRFSGRFLLSHDGTRSVSHLTENHGSRMLHNDHRYFCFPSCFSSSDKTWRRWRAKSQFHVTNYMSMLSGSKKVVYSRSDKLYTSRLLLILVSKAFFFLTTEWWWLMGFSKRFLNTQKTFPSVKAHRASDCTLLSSYKPATKT